VVKVQVSTQPIDVEALMQAMYAPPQAGAVASFVGLVRNHNEGRAVQALELEHYPGMTERCIEGIVTEAIERWNLVDATVIHRVGSLQIGEVIVLVLTASAHRRESLQACEFIIDYLKTQAPFWKREQDSDGQAHWVDARSSDDAALEKWQV
jgi:molybdopterin synthase catalytic subunit